MVYKSGRQVRLKPALMSFFIFLLLLSAGCAPKIKIKVLNPAEVDTAGIQKVAIGRFEIMNINRVFKIERNGDWQTKKVELTKEQKDALSNQIRARVINLMSTTPYFNLVYTDEFQKLENDAALQKAIAAGGYRTSDVDAVINGKIWLDVVNMDGAEIDKVNLDYIQGGSENSFNYTVQILAYWPYKSIRGSLAMEMKFTRLNPTKVLAVTFDTREAAYKIGGKPGNLQQQIVKGTKSVSSTIAHAQNESKEKEPVEESDLVLPSFDQLVADLAESIAAQFAQRISITEKEVSYPIATGGNSTVQMLIRAGAYEKAIDTLNRLLDQAKEKNPDDIYNLGLCYEATGDYGVAATTYNDAIKIDPGNLMYAQGIGRIEKLKRESRIVKEQLAERTR